MGTSDEDIQRFIQTTVWAEESQKKAWFKTEQPQHKLMLPEYWIGKYPITNAEYQAFVEDNRVPPPTQGRKRAAMTSIRHGNADPRPGIP